MASHRRDMEKRRRKLINVKLITKNRVNELNSWLMNPPVELKTAFITSVRLQNI